VNVCTLSYPACNAHGPYCQSVACSAALQYFSTFSPKRHDFRKKKNVIEHKMYVLILSTTFDRNISHSKKKWGRDEKKCTLVFMQSTRYSTQILTKLEFSGQIFDKYSNRRFHANPSSGSRDVPFGRTDLAKLPVVRLTASTLTVT